MLNLACNHWHNRWCATCPESAQPSSPHCRLWSMFPDLADSNSSHASTSMSCDADVYSGWSGHLIVFYNHSSYHATICDPFDPILWTSALIIWIHTNPIACFHDILAGVIFSVLFAVVGLGILTFHDSFCHLEIFAHFCNTVGVTPLHVDSTFLPLSCTFA